MNLQTVITNLRNTIAGKEKYLSEVYEDLDQTCGASEATQAVAEFLEINIAELKRILADVEQCEVQGKEFSTWAHWEQNPDRSGGQFTEEEINRAGEWR